VGKASPPNLRNSVILTPEEAPLLDDLRVSQCCLCNEYSVWYKKKMVFPNQGSVAPPTADLPEDVRQDYLEARSIVGVSPKGAAALLRLAIQKLCKHLGESGRNLNDDIASLVRKGLPVRVQKALDIVRVIGNEVVHPGQIDLNDNPEIAQKLFSLVNIITEEMITKPKEVDGLFSNLPAEKLEQIAKRDSTQGKSQNDIRRTKSI
jgi:hypothetical protein